MVIVKGMGSAARWGLALVLAMGVAAPPRVGAAARAAMFPAGGSRPAPDVTLEVKVAPAIVESAELRTWVEEEGRRVLDGLPKEPKRRGGVRVEIGGELYEYRVTITAVRDGVVVGVPSEWACECSNEELLERVRGELVAGAEGLVVEAEEPVVTLAPPVVKPTTGTVDDLPRRRLGPAGAAGVTLMVLGATGVGTGVALMVVGDQDLQARERVLMSRNFMMPGQLVTISSAGVLFTGVLLYALRKRIDREGRLTVGVLAPILDGSARAGFTLTGRF